jgi:hypothetical protein
VAKTNIAPADVSQLKKLFPEVVNGRDTMIEYGKAKLSSGEATVGLKKMYRELFVQITPIIDTPANYYSVAVMKYKDKFTIKSSDANDVSEVMWFVIGG